MEEENKMKEENECPVCFGSEQLISVFGCSHMICNNCDEQTKKHNLNACPLCRSKRIGHDESDESSVEDVRLNFYSSNLSYLFYYHPSLYPSSMQDEDEYEDEYDDDEYTEPIIDERAITNMHNIYIGEGRLCSSIQMEEQERERRENIERATTNIRRGLSSLFRVEEQERERIERERERQIERQMEEYIGIGGLFSLFSVREMMQIRREREEEMEREMRMQTLDEVLTRLNAELTIQNMREQNMYEQKIEKQKNKQMNKQKNKFNRHLMKEMQKKNRQQIKLQTRHTSLKTQTLRTPKYQFKRY